MLLEQLYAHPLARFPTPAGPSAWLKAQAWSQAVEAWLDHYTHPDRRREFCRDLASLLDDARKLPWEIRRRDVQAWLDFTLHGLAPGKRRHCLGSVSAFYSFVERTYPPGSPHAWAMGLPVDHPVRQQVRWPPNRNLCGFQVLDDEELACLLAAFDRHTPFGARDYALYLLILLTGRTAREVCALRCGDLELQDERRYVWRVRPGLQVDVPPEAMAAIWDYFRKAGRLWSRDPAAYVFTPLQDLAGHLATLHPHDWRDQPLLAHDTARNLKRYAFWADLDPERVTVRTLRYTGALLLLRRGAGPAEIGAFLGVKSKGWAIKIYLRLKQAATIPTGPHA